MSRFQRVRDPSRPGQLLAQGGEPVATVVWAHDFRDRDRTGWFLHMLDAEGEPVRRAAAPPGGGARGGAARRRRAARPRAWLAQAETVELVTAGAAVEAGERRLARLLGHPG
jgi:hypothetical protein